MKFIVLGTALILSCATFQTASSLETTATARDVKEANPEISVTAQNAIVTAAISKVNKDVLAILRCNNKNMFYKPKDGTADADGCVGATMSTTTTTKSKALGNVLFSSYPGYSKNSKGYIGSSTQTVDLSSLVTDGATSISVQGTLGGFTGGCTGVAGAKVWNIANVKTSVPFTEYQCKYDNSPNRSTFFGWSYNASNNLLTVRAKMSQTNSLMTGAKITGITGTYTVTKTVLKVGDGK